jgi:glycosyltransferase involved in cell wall biosynthesis
LRDLPPDSYQEINFEPDIFALYQLFNIFIHVPIDPSIEAFGQTYVEALAAGVPSVFTMSGIAPEFIRHRQNAFIVDFKDSQQIYEAMKEILHNGPLRNTLIQQGKEDVRSLFMLNEMVSKLERLYTNR